MNTEAMVYVEIVWSKTRCSSFSVRPGGRVEADAGAGVEDAAAAGGAAGLHAAREDAAVAPNTERRNVFRVIEAIGQLLANARMALAYTKTRRNERG
jgi:hypothetical protein